MGCRIEYFNSYPMHITRTNKIVVIIIIKTIFPVQPITIKRLKKVFKSWEDEKWEKGVKRNHQEWKVEEKSCFFRGCGLNARRRHGRTDRLCTPLLSPSPASPILSPSSAQYFSASSSIQGLTSKSQKEYKSLTVPGCSTLYMYLLFSPSEKLLCVLL